jgi:chromosome partitioning protein
VTDPQDHLVERGRAIFDRLRGGEPGDQQDHVPDEAATEAATEAGTDELESATTIGTSGSGAAPPSAPGEGAAEGSDSDGPEEAGHLGTDPEGPPGSVPEHGPGPTDSPAAEGDPADLARGTLPGAADLAPFTDAPTVTPAPADPPAPPGHEAADGSEASSGAISSPAGGGGREPGAAASPRPSPFARPLPRIMAIANQKGGVGKTTTAVNLGACLADLGYRVLVVDLDPQGNASTGLGINIRDLHGSMYDVVLHDLPIDDCVEATTVRNLFVAPSSLDLAGAEIELVPAFSRELRLRRALEEVADDYDFVLIDCPPSLGLLTVNGLAAATEVVVPIQCEYYALEGLGQLLRNVNLVQRNLNPRLELSAIILVMYDARTKLADQVVREVREHFGDKVCRNVVPRTVRLSEAPSFGQPIIAFDATSRGAIAYRELAKEVAGGAPQRAG